MANNVIKKTCEIVTKDDIEDLRIVEGLDWSNLKFRDYIEQLKIV